MSEVEAEVVEKTVEEAPEIDLSAVPEKVREHVDVERYTKDEDYKRAITHGWKPRDVFVADGGDEADWVGYRGFNRKHDDIQARKEEKRRLDEIKRDQDVLIRTMQQQEKAAYERGLREKEAELKVAISDGDAARAAELQRELLEKQQQAPAAPAQHLEPLAIRDIRRKNAFLNPDAPEYDRALSDEFIGIAREKAEAYFNAYGRKLSDYEIKVIADEAFDAVRDRAKKPAPVQAPKAPASAKPAASGKVQADPMKRLSQHQRKLYDKILDANGKVAADNFLKNILENG